MVKRIALLLGLAALLLAQTARPGRVTTIATTTAVAGPTEELVCVSNADGKDPLSGLASLNINCASAGYPAFAGALRIPLMMADGGSLRLTLTNGSDSVAFVVHKGAPNTWDVEANGVKGSGYFAPAQQ